MFRHARRPSHSTIVAYLALFVALGGSSYAALRVGSAQIVDNSIRSKDIRNNSVRGKDVRRDTLTGADIKESRLGVVPQAANAANAANAGSALSVADNTVTGAKVVNNSLGGIDIIESQLGTVPLATTALMAEDIEDGVVTGAKVPPNALTGDDIDESTLAGVNAATLSGLGAGQFTRRIVFGTVAHPFTVNIPNFGQLTTECNPTSTEWHYTNNTGAGQDIFMDVGGNDAVYAQRGNGQTLASGENGAAAPGAERIIWMSFHTIVFTTSVRTAPSACRMSGIAFIPGS